MIEAETDSRLVDCMILWDLATLQTLAPNVQDGSIRLFGISALFLDSRRKWREVVHLYAQSGGTGRNQDIWKPMQSFTVYY